MKVNLTYIIKQPDGKTPVVIDGEELTVKSVCINSLLTASHEDDGDTKFADYELFKRIKDGDEVELSAEEIVRLKKKIGVLYQPIVVGQSYEVLEGKL